MIFLGLGTNIGDRVANLERAYAGLEEEGVQILRKSSIYESPPWGITEQEAFLNTVCEVAFQGDAYALLAICLQVELDMGRERFQKWGPRLIDIDVLEFNRQQMKTERLTLPHPFYPIRDFVLIPMAELEPNWVPTGDDEPVMQLVQEDHGIVRYEPK